MSSSRSGSRSLGRELAAARGFSLSGLLLAVVGSVVGTVLVGAATGPWGALAGAAIMPVVSTVFTTGQAGEGGRVRIAAIVLLSGAALAITVTGVALADRSAGHSVVPGMGERESTFPDVRAAIAPPDQGEGRSGGGGQKGPGIEVHPGALDCGEAVVGDSGACAQPLTITSTGNEPLRITRLELTGEQPDDFEPGDGCVGESLPPQDTCQLTVTFRPSAAGGRAATLVIHQNLPLPDTGTPVALTGTGEDGGGGGVTLEVAVEDPDAVTVVSEPAGITCPDTCRALFPPGTDITLTARSDQDGGQVEWIGCDQSGDACSLRLDADRTVLARRKA